MPAKKTTVEKVLQFLPASIIAIEGVSKAKGAHKKAEAIAMAAGALPLTPKEKKAVGLVNDAIVLAFNLIGQFTSKKKAPVK